MAAHPLTYTTPPVPSAWLACLTLPTVFGELDAEAQAALQAELEVVQLALGQTLFHQGDRGDSLYVLVVGRLSVQIQNPTGETVVVDEATPYQLIGEMALLTGQSRGATITAVAEATLLRLSKAGFDRLEQHHPIFTQRLAQTILPRLRQQQLLHILTKLFGPLDKTTLAALQQKLDWRYLSAGETLIRQGEASDAAYIVVNGRLRVTMRAAARQGEEREQFIREIGAGEVIGEVGLLTNAPRSATVTALRAATVVRLSASVCEALVTEHPQVMVQVARMMAGRQVGAAEPKPQTAPTLTFTLVASDPATPLTVVALHLAQVFNQWGETLYLDSTRFDERFGKTGAAQARPDDPLHLPISGWLSQQEDRYRFILLQADPTWTPWTERCTQQADRILLVKRAQAAPALDEIEIELAKRHSLIPQELLLLQLTTSPHPTGTKHWLMPRQVTMHHHLRLDNNADWQRLARRLTGRAIALVLGGGGARGNAHIGVIRALLEANLPIDLIGGTSIGAVVSAFYAYNLDYAFMQELGRRYSSKQRLLDYTLPFTALVGGAKTLRQFQAIFGETAIEDLWLPCFAVSCNLSRATAVVHKQGPLWLVLRASTAIPGVFAPVPYEGDVLVDGGVVNNFPVDIMRQHYQPGAVIGVNLDPPREALQGYHFGPSTSGWQILWSRLNPFARAEDKPFKAPSLMNILLRTQEFHGIQSMRATQSLVDLLIEPPVASIRIDAFDAYQIAHDLGYQAATKALATAPPTWRPDLFQP
ncbi:MAG: cyclic nucleotide-binding domain-containing protein [Caldilineaceae bacterium]